MNYPSLELDRVDADRVQFWTAGVMTGAAALLALLAVWALAATEPTGLGRVAYAVVGVVNLVAAAVSGLVVRQRLTGRDAVDEEIARFGSLLCIMSGTLLSNAATGVDEPDWRGLFFGLGLLLALGGAAMAAVAPQRVRSRLGLDTKPSD